MHKVTVMYSVVGSIFTESFEAPKITVRHWGSGKAQIVLYDISGAEMRVIGYDFVARYEREVLP